MFVPKIITDKSGKLRFHRVGFLGVFLFIQIHRYSSESLMKNKAKLGQGTESNPYPCHLSQISSWNQSLFTACSV